MGQRTSLRCCITAWLTIVAGCSENDTEWFRAEQDYWGTIIYRAGLEDDSCLVIYVGGYPNGSPLEEQPALEGVEAHVPGQGDTLSVWARELDVGADHCGIAGFIYGDFAPGSTPITQGSGTLRFIESDDADGDPRICTIEIDAAIGSTLIDERVPITGFTSNGCPKVAGETFEVDVLGASSPNTREDFLALRSWNEELEVCYGLDFWLYEGEPGQEEPALPEGWRLNEASMTVFTTREDCEQGIQSAPSPDNGFEPSFAWDVTDSARGWLVFDESQPWINPLDDTPTPCRVSVDISVDFWPLLHWTPTTLRFVDEDIPVALTCGN
ncbi:MAG: hypothetical protein KDK70_22430 [Myxococcales bacterium]|nr:hypothetical protein [Myxococcales bacterium]